MMQKADTLVTTAQLTAWLCAHCTQLSLKFTMLWSHIQLHSVYMICLSFVVPQTSVKKHHLLFEPPYMYQPTRTFPCVANFTFPYTSGPHRVEQFRHSSKIGAGSRSSTLLARRCDDVCCACADDRCSRNATVTKLMKNDVTRLVLLYNETKHAARWPQCSQQPISHAHTYRAGASKI